MRFFYTHFTIGERIGKNHCLNSLLRAAFTFPVSDNAKKIIAF